MDPRAQGDLGRLLRDMAAGEGVSVLVASHDVEFLAAWADRLVVLDGGRVVAGGPPPETLFGLKGFRTVLQRWTGRPWPASPRDLLPRRG
jgi:iron complex transport system ATP-binding protein